MLFPFFRGGGGSERFFHLRKGTQLKTTELGENRAVSAWRPSPGHPSRLVASLLTQKSHQTTQADKDIFFTGTKNFKPTVSRCL